jgi:hypothetical protein
MARDLTSAFRRLAELTFTQCWRSFRGLLLYPRETHFAKSSKQDHPHGRPTFKHSNLDKLSEHPL